MMPKPLARSGWKKGWHRIMRDIYKVVIDGDEIFGKVAECIIKKQEKIEELEKQNRVLLRAMELLMTENEWFDAGIYWSYEYFYLTFKYDYERNDYNTIQQFNADLLNLCYAIAEYELSGEDGE